MPFSQKITNIVQLFMKVFFSLFSLLLIITANCEAVYPLTS